MYTQQQQQQQQQQQIGQTGQNQQAAGKALVAGCKQLP